MNSNSTRLTPTLKRMALAVLAVAATGCGHMMHARHGGMAGMDTGGMQGCCCMAGGHAAQHGAGAHGAMAPQAGTAPNNMVPGAAHGTGMPAMQGQSRYLPQQMAAAGPMCGAGGSSCCGGSASGGCCGAAAGAHGGPAGQSHGAK